MASSLGALMGTGADANSGAAEALVRLAEKATVLALERQLGLKRDDGLLAHSPLTLLPWQIGAAEFAEARSIARAIGRRLAALAASPAELQQALTPILAGTSLPAQLWRQWQTIPASERRAQPVNLIRVDLLHDRAGQWKLVEANSIAAGMGPFSEGLAQIQQELWPDLVQAGLVSAAVPPVFAPNPAVNTLADALHMAAMQQVRVLQHVQASASAQAARMQPARVQRVGASIPAQPLASTTPLIVFVVEPNEDNIFDQRKIAQALEQRGCRVVRLTLAEIDARLDRAQAPLCVLRDIGVVHALYFRTGYNPADYRSGETHDTSRLLRLRAELETLQIALAPTIPLQLASAKAVQAHWAANINDGVDFAALHTGHQFMHDLCAPNISDWSEWLLKSQGEGGGNVVQGDAIPLQLEKLSAREKPDWLLMRRIHVTPRSQVVPMLRKGRIEFVRHLMSELGLFVLGDDLHDGGYLLRSKPVHALETGVHRGEGMIDVVALAG